MPVPLNSASWRTALAAGRIDWTAPPGHRTVYTIQAFDVWEALESDRAYAHARPGSPDEHFRDAYAWMGDQIAERLAVDMTDRWPIWGWTRTTRKHLLGSCQRSPGEVLLKLHVPVEHLLESHFDLWHFALNGWFLPEPHIDPQDPEWEAIEEDFRSRLAEAGLDGRTPAKQWPAGLRAEAEQSWEQIFDLETWGYTPSVQATMPELRMEWVGMADVLTPHS